MSQSSELLKKSVESLSDKLRQAGISFSVLFKDKTALLTGVKGEEAFVIYFYERATVRHEITVFSPINEYRFYPSYLHLDGLKKLERDFGGQNDVKIE